MNFRRWKLGLLVALVIGFFTACIAAGMMDVRLNAKFFFFFVGLIGKDVVLFLVNHPLDQLPPDKELNGTTHFTQAREEKLADDK